MPAGVCSACCDAALTRLEDLLCRVDRRGVGRDDEFRFSELVHRDGLRYDSHGSHGAIPTTASSAQCPLTAWHCVHATTCLIWQVAERRLRRRPRHRRHRPRGQPADARLPLQPRLAARGARRRRRRPRRLRHHRQRHQLAFRVIQKPKQPLRGKRNQRESRNRGQKRMKQQLSLATEKPCVRA